MNRLIGCNMPIITIEQQQLIVEAARLKEIERLSKWGDKDSKEVAEFTKKFGLGSVDWQKAMMKRIKLKNSRHEQHTIIDELFLSVQEAHTTFLKDYLRSMGASGIILN